MSDLLERVAGAPITWGVDGSPGWGYLMDRDRVLREMVESGLHRHGARARWLPPDRPGRAAGLPRPVRPEHRRRLRAGPALPRPTGSTSSWRTWLAPRGSSRRPARRCSSSGRRRTNPGYDTPVDMIGRRVDDVPRQPAGGSKAIVSDAGLETALHPHWGMAIATGTGHRPAARVVGRRVVPRHRPRLPGRRGPGRHRPGRRAIGSSMSTSRTSTRPRPSRSGAARSRSARRSSTGCSCRSGEGGVDIAGVIAGARGRTGIAAGMSSNRTYR